MAFATLSWISVYPSAGAPRHLLGGEIAGGADPVLDDELLAEPIGQPLSHETRGEIATAAGRKADDKTHRPRRIGLRPRDVRHGRQRGNARGQMQEFAAGKFHGVPRLSCGGRVSCRCTYRSAL